MTAPTSIAVCPDADPRRLWARSGGGWPDARDHIEERLLADAQEALLGPVEIDDDGQYTDGVGGPQDPEVLLTPDEIVAELPGFRVVRAAESRRPGKDGIGPVDAIVRAIRGES